MMENNNKYQRGKIYRIVCNTTGLQYYGSTCEKYLSYRLAKHKNNYKNYLIEKYNFVTSFKIIESDNYEIVLVENFPCKSKDELNQRERFYIENNECVNKVIPCRTREEYREENKEHMKEYMKEYNEKNKEYMKEYFKEYYEKNKNKKQENNKKWCEQNKEKIKEYQKKWRQDNKEKMKEYFKDRCREKQRKKTIDNINAFENK